MLKGIFEHVDDLYSKPCQCENKSELELKYVLFRRKRWTCHELSMLIMNILYAYYVLNGELLPVALYM